MQLTRDNSFGRWVGIVVPLLLVIGLMILWGLHVRLRKPIVELAVPVISYVGIQVFFVLNMFWAGKLARHRNDWKAAIILGGGYCWSSGILLLYYGNKWGFLTTDRHDYMLFSVLLMIAVLFVAIATRFIVPPKEPLRP